MGTRCTRHRQLAETRPRAGRRLAGTRGSGGVRRRARRRPRHRAAVHRAARRRARRALAARRTLNARAFTLHPRQTGVYSVNAPVPAAVNELAAELRPALTEFDRV